MLLKTLAAVMTGLMQRKNLDMKVRVVKKTKKQGRVMQGTQRRNKEVINIII